ncbi:MAG: helix-turn-helix transcriptional regulator [Oscillospiraceae bacterium]
MKKTERLHDMLLYLNDKKSFNLKNIMGRYSVSKSTALRDVQSLEEMGMPIYSTPGRGGHYGILPNRLLSPIVFSMEEVRALYFSMQTLAAYQSTPFHLNAERLKQKFESCLAAGQIEKLRKMEAVFSLGGGQSGNECACLEEVLARAVDGAVCEIRYAKEAAPKRYWVQFFNITAAYGQWYATAYNFKTKRPQVFRCDKIHAVTPSAAYAPKPLLELLPAQNSLFRGKAAVDFAVYVSARGADIFYKEHYPTMALHREKTGCCIRGFYNPGEETFIANYFMAFGETIVAVQPAGLKTLLLERLSAMAKHLAAV